MTVIAWDGKTLAADKMANFSGLKGTVTKIRAARDALLFVSGDFDAATNLYAWYEAGAILEAWPKFQEDKDAWMPLHAVKRDGSIWRYERRPYPFLIEEKKFAVGSGRDFALAAMHMGADAVEAVKVACQFDPGCGLGIDTLTLGDLA